MTAVLEKQLKTSGDNLDKLIDNYENPKNHQILSRGGYVPGTEENSEFEDEPKEEIREEDVVTDDEDLDEFEDEDDDEFDGDKYSEEDL